MRTYRSYRRYEAYASVDGTAAGIPAGISTDNDFVSGNTDRGKERIGAGETFRIREPGSALTHFIGFIGAVLMMPVMLIHASNTGADTMSLTAAAVFMISMILLYAASTSYHSFDISARANKILKKFDHLSIFALIAGSYTPFCLITLRGSEGYRLLACICGLAAAGMIFKLFWVTCPKWVSSIIYTAMGWMCIMVIPDMVSGLGAAGFGWLLAGGLFYTAGAVIYALRFDVFGGRFKNFGTHELFHVFVLAGSLCHYITVYYFCF